MAILMEELISWAVFSLPLVFSITFLVLTIKMWKTHKIARILFLVLALICAVITALEITVICALMFSVGHM